MVTRWVLLLPMIGLLSACATVPTGPSVMVLPAVGKPFDQFQVDDMVCRQRRIRFSADWSSTAVLGTLVGAGAGAAIGAAAGDAGLGAAIGAGSGLLFGTAGGAEAGAGASRSLQWRYDVSYVQCMYAKGNQVPGTPPPPNGAPRPPATVPPPR